MVEWLQGAYDATIIAGSPFADCNPDVSLLGILAKGQGGNDDQAGKDGQSQGGKDDQAGKDGQSQGGKDDQAGKDGQSQGGKDDQAGKDGQSQGGKDDQAGKDGQSEGGKDDQAGKDGQGQRGKDDQALMGDQASKSAQISSTDQVPNADQLSKAEQVRKGDQPIEDDQIHKDNQVEKVDQASVLAQARNDAQVGEQIQGSKIAPSGQGLSGRVDKVTDIQSATDKRFAEWQMNLSRTFTKDDAELGPYRDAPHDFMREQCAFSDATTQFLSRYASRFPVTHDSKNGSSTFSIPLNGITSRRLPGDDSSEPKYFHATMKVTVPEGADNLDQCTFERGLREEETREQYLKGINEELNGAADLPAHQGPLCFFAHGAFTGAGTADNDAIRLAMLSGVPTVNIDWRSTPGPWYSLPFRYPIDYKGAVSQEKSFEPALDATFIYIGPNHGAFVSFSRGTGFDATYMQHRFANRDVDPPISANILAHADLQTSLFKVFDQGVNPIVNGSPNTIVLGNPHDGALKVGRIRIAGDRVGDAQASDIKVVTAAGGKYVIDQYQHCGGDFNHYIDYKVIAKMIRTMVVNPGPETPSVQFIDRIQERPLLPKPPVFKAH